MKLITKLSSFSNLNTKSLFCGLHRKANHTLAPVQLAYNTYENVKGPADTPPLIVMHGLFGSKFNWNSLCKAIHAKSQPTRKIICVDARNHADSPWSDEHSYAHMAADVHDLLQRLNIEKAAILGHSMGGRAMMYFALQYPELVERAIIVDISPISGLGTNMTNIPLFLNAMRAIQIPATQTIHQGRQEADRQLSRIIDEKSLRDFLITNLVKSEDGSFSWRINLEALERNFLDNIALFPDMTDVKRYDGPVLFIGGERSDYLKRSDFPQIQKIFPVAELQYIANAGHWVHSEKPAEFMQLVLNFLNK